jgi:peptidoglycan/LPS O-acetylase OafA/YrhL
MSSYIFFKRFYWIIIIPIILCVSLISVGRETGGGKFMIVGLLRKGGEYSFTFYMIHVLCIGLFARLSKHLVMDIWWTSIITFTGTMIASVICQKYFVEPVAKILMKKIIKK